jgi:mRNA-degrading endonuclease RelE of RelBE toxin-antitoxin system
MTLPLAIILTKSAAKSLQSLDAPTRKRMQDKIESIAADPYNPRNSYPLQGTEKRSARVGGYRILLLIREPNLLVVDIESRGQVYRRI